MDPFEKYYTLALLQLGRRLRSEKELRDYLVRKKASSDVIDKVIQRVQEQKFQSDIDFAKWWVASRIRLKAKSNRIIGLELRQKGIAVEIINAALAEKTDDFKSEYDKAHLTAQKYMKKITNLPKQEQYRRLGVFLSQRGFDYDTVKRVIDDVLQRVYNT